VLRNVPKGEHTVRIRAFGFRPIDRTVTVTDSGRVTIRVTLVQNVTVLSGVVTTVAGVQRKVAVGSDIVTIDVDSVMRTGAITTFTDLLSGRVPGLLVLPSSGQIGAPVRLRSRGITSLSLSNDPIIIIDGVRFNNQVRSMANAGVNASAAPTSPLSDLAPENIQSIEVVKGPSATTLYGTDAANGVIVITTKRGRPGETRWDLSVPFGPIEAQGTKSNFPETWIAYGHSTDGSETPLTCQLVDPPGGPYFMPGQPGGVAGRNDGTCIVDSVGHFSPLNKPSLSVLGRGWVKHVNGSVSGGSSLFNYFLSGDIDDQTSGVRIPDDVVQQAKDRGTPLSSAQIHPNAVATRSAHGTFSVTPAPELTITSVTNVGLNTSRSVAESRLLQILLSGTGVADSTFRSTTGALLPFSSLFATMSSDDAKRLVQSFTGNWAHQWLNLRGTAGADYSSTNATTIEPPNTQVSPPTTGSYGQTLGTSAAYSWDVGGTATVPVRDALTSRTSIGSQYTRQVQEQTTSQGTPLKLGNTTLNGTTTRSVNQGGATTATLGGYIEQQFSYAERLWMTAGARWDGGSGFGGQYNVTAYPKADLSWLVYTSGQTHFRLRAAYGKSGTQASIRSKTRLFGFDQGMADGVVASGASFSSIGNAVLRPERSREFETGFDLTALGSAVELIVTPYWKKTVDELVTIITPASIGFFSRSENLGNVTNRGVEATLTLRPIDRPAFAWDMTVSGSYNANRLTRITAHADSLNSAVGGALRYIVGYPVAGVWGNTVHYSDADGNGLISPDEVQIDTALSYFGPSTAPRQLTFMTGVSFLNGTLRVNAMVNSQSGNVIYSQTGYNDANCGSLFGVSYSRGCNDPDAPLAEQAASLAAGMVGTNNQGNTPALSPFVYKGWVARFQELGVNYVIAPRLLRALRLPPLRQMDLSLAVRNLATWTHYPGIDPSVNYNYQADQVVDNGTLPQPRTWVLRFHVGL
jgi:TonB-dependent SusC/RagA subfamily outer membrane receptor